MGLEDDIKKANETDDAEKLRAMLIQARRQRTAADQVNSQLIAQVEELQRALDIVDSAEMAQLAPPKWLVNAPSNRKKHATLVLLLSDTHFDEVVDPVEVGGLNAYNRKIAELRLQTWVENAVNMARHYLSGVTYDGVVVMLGGDIFSGDIHEELSNTNETVILDSLLHWSEQVAAALGVFADEFGKVHVPCVVGNHGRLTRKPRMKQRAKTNLDWLLGKMVERHFQADKRITFQVSENADTLVPIYGHGHLLTHGDQVNGGGGIGGIWPPIMRLRARKAQRAMEVGQPFETLWMGHWHQYISTPYLVINGCFPAGALVATPSGPIPIEQIEMGATIIGGDGNLETVTHRFVKDTDRLVHLHVRGIPRELSATPNHLVWAIKGEATRPVEPSRRHLVGGADKPQWIPADFISAGDWVHVPTPKADPNNRPIETDLAWLYGLFLAEGHTTIDGGGSKNVNAFGLTMHAREVPILERAADIIKKYWPDTNPVRISIPTKRPNTANLIVNGRELPRHFRDLFGRYSHGKLVPDWFLTMAPELQASVVDGWVTGDGHTRADGVTSATTVSSNLAWCMFYMSFHTGKLPSMALIRAGGPRKRDTYTIHMNAGQEARQVDGDVFYRVQNRYSTAEPMTVYDLEVSGSHTYTVNGVHVHNSTKGLDEYAWINNFGFEVPQQALAIVTPEHNITVQAPVFCQNKKEKW